MDWIFFISGRIGGLKKRQPEHFDTKDSNFNARRTITDTDIQVIVLRIILTYHCDNIFRLPTTNKQRADLWR